MKMTKKKSKSIYEFTLDDANFLSTSDILTFATEPPEIFEVALKTLRESLKYNPPEPGMTPLEFILRRLEKEARQVLTQHGYPTEIDELLSLESDHTQIVKLESGGSGYKCDVDIHSLSAKRVLFSASNLREYIANNDAEQASIEMMRLLYAAFNMCGFEFIMRGVRVKRGYPKGGGARKVKDGIVAAIQKIFNDNGLKLKNIDIWNYLKDNHNPENQQDPILIDKYEIYFQILDGEERIVEAHLHEDPNMEKIFTVSKSTFLKKYVPMVRKRLTK